jgi:hypothetical protein
MIRQNQPPQRKHQTFIVTILLPAVALVCICGCQRKMSQEEVDKAVAGFKGGPPGPDEAAVQAKERATAEAYRKAHPEKFPPFTK